MASAGEEGVRYRGQLPPSKYVKRPDFMTNTRALSTLDLT